MPYINKEDTKSLFALQNQPVDNDRFIFKNEESNFVTDWHRSNFYYLDSSGNEVQFSPVLSEENLYNTLSTAEQKQQLNDILIHAFPDKTVRKTLIKAYTQSIPLIISRHILGMTKIQNFIPHHALSTGHEHTVKKIFSIQNGRGHLKLENTVVGADCKIVANLIINDNGYFELEAPIRLTGEDANFIHALWFDDYSKINQYWPSHLDKTLFNNFVNNLEQQLKSAVDEFNQYRLTKEGGKKLGDDSALFQVLQNFINETHQVIKNQPIVFEQKLQLTEAIQRMNSAIYGLPIHFVRYAKMCEKLSRDQNIFEGKQFRLIVGSLLTIATLVLCAGFIAIAVSSFGLAPPIAFGAILITTNLLVAIPAIFGALSSAFLAVRAGFFAASGKVSTKEAGLSAACIATELAPIKPLIEEDLPSVSNP